MKDIKQQIIETLQKDYDDKLVIYYDLYGENLYDLDILTNNIQNTNEEGIEITQEDIYNATSILMERGINDGDIIPINLITQE